MPALALIVLLGLVTASCEIDPTASPEVSRSDLNIPEQTGASRIVATTTVSPTIPSDVQLGEGLSAAPSVSAPPSSVAPSTTTTTTAPPSVDSTTTTSTLAPSTTTTSTTSTVAPTTTTSTTTTTTTAQPSAGAATFAWPGGAGWKLETKGTESEITEGPGPAVTCTVGGDAGSKYARVRHKLGDEARTGAFRLTVDVELPADFHDDHDSFMRLLTTDNFGAAANDREWRVGFVLGVDGRPKLMSLHEAHEANHLTLWEGSEPMPTGRHTLDLWFDPAAEDGGWVLQIDGVVVGSGDGVRTIPTSVSAAEAVVTRAGGCIDGASNQAQPVSVILHGVTFRTEAPRPG